MNMIPRLLAVILGGAMAACGGAGDFSSSGRGAIVPIEEPCQAYYGACGSYCGDGVCTDVEDCSNCPTDCGACWDPNVINVYGTPTLVSMNDVRAKAEALGITPLQAGVPNIETFLQNQPGLQPSFALQRQPDLVRLYPLNTTSPQDFVNKLFQSGIWANTAPTPPPPTSLPNDNNCTQREVTFGFNAEELVTFDSGTGLLFPSALIQGKDINLGGGSITTIHVPYSKRKPANLIGTFWQSGVASTATATDVNGTIFSMIQAANQQGGLTQSSVAFESTSASSVEEATAKFKLDLKLLGGNISAKFSNLNTTQSNTVFVKFTQSLFTVYQDLQGFTPPQGQFNTGLTVTDLEALGDMGELGYDNLPTYVRTVTYGRILIFSVTSTTSLQELEAAVNAVYGPNSGGGSYEQKKLISESTMRVYGFGGPAEPQVAVIQSGKWTDYFTLVNVPLTTLKPLGYELRRWDDKLANMVRTTKYTERICPAIHKMKLTLSNIYKQAQVYVTPAGSNTENYIGSYGTNATIDLNPHLSSGTDKLRVFIQGGRDWFLGPWKTSLTATLYVDEVVRNNFFRDCSSCHSADVVNCYVNKVTGTTTCQ